jgi:hypothetical protein
MAAAAAEGRSINVASAAHAQVPHLCERAAPSRPREAGTAVGRWCSMAAACACSVRVADRVCPPGLLCLH